MPYYGGKSVKTAYCKSYLIVRTFALRSMYICIIPSTHFYTTPRTALIVLRILRTYIKE